MPHVPLTVPFGLAPDGSLVPPHAADPTTPYACPGCGAPLRLRHTGVRRSHFAHRRGQGCSAESVLHRAAKGLVVRVVEEAIAGTGPRPAIARRCSDWTCDGGVVQDLPDDITAVASEYRLPDGSIADVVLLRGDEPACVIEILVTHAVEPDKAARMRLPWVELGAQDLVDRPYWWVALQDGLRPFACPRCAARNASRDGEIASIQARAAAVAQHTGQLLPPSPPYHFAPHHCWRCGTEMVLFLWPGGGGHSARNPPPPRPGTVRLCATEGYGAPYWANCCPACDAVQGDWHLARGNSDYARLVELVGAIAP
ncbi:MAG: hypothetical protein FIA95_07110 [Gemmatimonadetes bacterium]|nr:hypothetical protein [Gemmatimonadota bacterium]